MNARQSALKRLLPFGILGGMSKPGETADVVVELKSKTRGVVNPVTVRWIAFFVITVSLVACTVLCILAIWKFTESDAVWRAIATFIVVSIATAIFAFVNEKLG